MAFGFGVLRLDGAAFWALTPRELAAALHGVHGPARQPPERSRIEALMRAFPDGDER
jgi:uncharacterized phage protein (TIGR02216 family)